MAVSRPVIERLPLWFLFFVGSVGFFVIISFPFDIFPEELTIPKECDVLLHYVSTEFAPFVNLKHLGVDFPIRFIEILLASLAIGVIIYLLHNIYRAVNGKVMKGRIRKILWKHGKFPQKVQLSIIEGYNFDKWLHEKAWFYLSYLKFSGTIPRITLGLLYGSETFFLFNATHSVIVGVCMIKNVCTLSILLDSLGWLGVAIVFVVILYIIHLNCARIYNRSHKYVLETYRTLMEKAIEEQKEREKKE